jgi:TRAP-type C4-dicarboxylate transport system substrate-binding protein
MRTIRVGLALAVGMAVGLAAAGPVTIKLATFAPSNSTWHKALMDMGAAWTKATQGRVRLVIYAGGTQGSEAATVKLMRPSVGQLQASLLTQPGLAEIDDVFDAFGIPFFFESNEELEFVVSRMTPLVKQRLEAKGFVLVHWGNAGWIQVFSKKPIKTLADLKHAKLYTTEGNDRMVQWYKRNGFHPVPLSYNDIPAQLKLRTGMIDAAPAPPYGALALQFYRDAPNMLEVSVAPMVGATIVTVDVWSRISETDRAKMLEVSARTERDLAARVPRLDADSIGEMRKTGLTVTSIEGAALAEFRTTADELAQTMRGSMVPADVYDLAFKCRNEFRQSKGGAS